MRYTSKDVARKVELINVRLRAAGKPDLYIQSTNPDGKSRRYEFAGWVYHGASEAGRALDAMLFIMRELCITETQSAYVARAIDVARSDRDAAVLLSPVERDELLRHFGGRRNDKSGDDECPNPWHGSAPARRSQTCPECPVTQVGYICKSCGGPSPLGVGYVDNSAGAAARSAGRTGCDCGQSRSAVDDSDDDMPEVPDDFPVRPLDADDDTATDPVTCGTCGRRWDDAVSTSYTPAPSARCPFEAFHS